MISILRRNLVYKDINSDIVEHDDDIDADEWCYENRDVYRGTFDPEYTKYDLNVYWLYDQNLKRIGLAEHEMDDPAVFEVLWFYDNSFATLYQSSNWKSTGKTLWSKLTHEAYSDCLEDDFNSVFDRCLSSKYRLVTPLMIIHKPVIYECTHCKKRSIKPFSCRNIIKLPYYGDDLIYLFVDESFLLYELIKQPSVSYEQEQPEVEEELLDEEE